MSSEHGFGEHRPLALTACASHRGLTFRDPVLQVVTVRELVRLAERGVLRRTRMSDCPHEESGRLEGLKEG
jgi:hypothetical protein